MSRLVRVANAALMEIGHEPIAHLENGLLTIDGDGDIAMRAGALSVIATYGAQEMMRCRLCALDASPDTPDCTPAIDVLRGRTCGAGSLP